MDNDGRCVSPNSDGEELRSWQLRSAVSVNRFLAPSTCEIHHNLDEPVETMTYHGSWNKVRISQQYLSYEQLFTMSNGFEITQSATGTYHTAS